MTSKINIHRGKVHPQQNVDVPVRELVLQQFVDFASVWYDVKASDITSFPHFNNKKQDY